MKMKNEKTNTSIDLVIGFGENEENNGLFCYIDDNIRPDMLCYSMVALISEFYRRVLNIKLTETEKVKDSMQYLEKMLLRFPIEFSMEIEKSEDKAKAEDEVLERLKDQIPPELLELVEKRRKDK
jgi:hypothetical protein